MKYLMALCLCLLLFGISQAQEKPQKELTLSKESSEDANKKQNKMQLEKPSNKPNVIRLDNPAVVPDKKETTSKSDKTKKNEPNAFQKAIANHHDQNIKNFVKGEAFLLTGRTAKYANEDSLIFKDFQYAQKFVLKDSLLADIGKVLSDTSHFAPRGYEILGVFAPKLGLKLTDSKGNVSEYVFAIDVMQANKGGRILPVSKEATAYFDNLADLIFRPNPPAKHTAQNTK